MDRDPENGSQLIFQHRHGYSSALHNIHVIIGTTIVIPVPRFTKKKIHKETYHS